jgi:hypothetical protein
MNVLTTAELRAYKDKLKELMDVKGTDSATVLTALQAFDTARQNDRLNHVVSNLVRNYAPQGAIAGGIETVTIGTAGTGYAVGDVINIVSSTGQGGSVTVATVGGTGDVTGLTIDSAGYGYAGTDTLTATGSGDGAFAGTLTVANVEESEQDIVNAIITALNP